MKNITLVLGIIVLGLGLFGAISGDTILGNAMNVDLMLDITRMTLGSLLIAGAVISMRMTHIALTIFAIVYLGTFILGLFSSTLFGLLPNGLGWFDQILHLGGGILALALVYQYKK